MTAIEKIPSPAYVIDIELLRGNLEKIAYVAARADVEIILALKACAMWAIFPVIREYVGGATASSLAEARLVYEEFGTPAHLYAPTYTDRDFDRLVRISSHITFNSLTQFERFGQRALMNGISCGLRINPEYSTVETDLYNPCVEGSRLGIPASELETLPAEIEGLHFHTLCESRPDDLRKTLEAVEIKFGHLLKKIKWLNMGGGHLMTHEDYDRDELVDILREFRSRYPNLRIILEPGSAFTWRTGYLVATVEDIIRRQGVNTAMLNVSFACHMPDCLEMPYKPTVVGAHDPQEGETKWRLGGNSCLAGDYCGDWAFDKEPQVGDRIIFEDMIHYTMVKTTMFNGVAHPSIVTLDGESNINIIKEFGYEDFKNRMS